MGTSKRYKKNCLLMKLFILLTFFSMVKVSSAQVYPWQTADQLSFQVNSVTDDAYAYDAVYDNYGLHMVAMDITAPGGRARTLDYYLVGNDGEAIEQHLDFADDDIWGFSMARDGNNIYVITVKGNTLKVYEKQNVLPSTFQLKLTETQSDYDIQNVLPSGLVQTDMKNIDGKLYMVLDHAGYNDPPNFGISTIGLITYEIVSNDLEYLSPIDNNQNHPTYAGGLSPKIVLQEDGNDLKLYMVYTKTGVNPTSLFVFREATIDGALDYEDPVFTDSWGVPQFGSYVPISETRADLLIQGTDIYIYSNLTNNVSPITTDTKYKVTPLTAIDWNTTLHDVHNNAGTQFTSPQFFEYPENGKIDFAYSRFVTSPFDNWGTIRELNISTGQLETPADIYNPSSSYAITGLITSTGTKGDFVIYSNGGGGDYVSQRRPRAITEDVTYNMLLTGDEYFNAPASPYIHSNGADISGKDNSVTTVKANTRVYIDAGDVLSFENGACVVYEENGEFINNGGTIDPIPFCVTWDSLACIATREGGITKLKSGLSYTFDNASFMVVGANSTLQLGDNTVLTFDGPYSHLTLDPTSTIKMGQNAKIKFINGAYLIADSVTFTSSGDAPQPRWEGIVLDNPGIQTIITNCTFSDAKKSITLTNDSTNAYNNYVIQNNTFNLPDSTAYGIYAENVFNLQLSGNTFTHQPNKGSSVFIKNFYNSGQDGGDGLPNFHNLNITNNTFTNAQNSLVLLSYASNLTPFYIYGNTFNGTSGQYNLLGRMLTGIIKNNNFANTNVSKAIYLTQSNPKLSGNIIKSDGANLISANSYPSLAPTRDGNGNFVWNAGGNTLNSTTGDNIQTDKGNVYTDYGNNSFTVSSTSKYHMYGRVDSNVIKYYSRNNCWSPGNVPLNFVWDVYVNGEFHQLPFIYNSPGYTCSQTYTADSYNISDMGGGIYDTVSVSDDGLGTPVPADEEMYTTAADFYNQALYTDAVAAYKNLIDNHTASTYLGTALYDLYASYEHLDTLATAGATDTLYSSLKSFLEAKINSGNYDKDFEDDAYIIIGYCDAAMKNYNSALDAFEFIALFHPDPNVRLNASWDYAEIETLFNSQGTGGGIADKKDIFDMAGIQKILKKRYDRMDKLSDRDPLLKKMKKSYKEQEEEREQNLKSVLTKKLKDGGKVNRKLKEKQDTDKRINQRASTNLVLAKIMSKDERRNRQLEDILLAASNSSIDTESDNIINEMLPTTYELKQNYPNPFNPVTSISYALPKDAVVKLKVYDISGREIMVLVNEFRTAGNYSVNFNGSNLASGVYFYRLEANNFTETKKMVLMK